MKVEEHVVLDAVTQFELGNMPKNPKTFKAFVSGILYIIASDIEAHITGGLSAEEILSLNIDFFEKYGEAEGHNRTSFDVSDLEIPEEFQRPHPGECDHEAVIFKHQGSFQMCADCGEVFVNE